MYHAIVRHKVAGIFKALNKGNYEPVLRMTARHFEHRFAGEHALSGCRTDLDLTRTWYERLFRIFPNLRFQVQNIVINGWPWNTTVAVEWTDSYTLLNGESRSNSGVHFIRLKWGRGVSVRIYCDTEQLLQNLAIQHRGGIADAVMEPLVA